MDRAEDTARVADMAQAAVMPFRMVRLEVRLAVM